MGHSQASKAATRERLVVTAARRLLREGTNGASVADIAADAHITAGAIYRHFASRDVLLREAFATAATVLGDWSRRSPDFDTAVSLYLSPAHRDAVDAGCPVAALASDMAHGTADDALRGAFTAHVRGVIDMLAHRLAPEAGERARAEAILSWCACVGALGLSRAIPDASASGELLADVAAELTQWPSRSPRMPR